MSDDRVSTSVTSDSPSQYCSFRVGSGLALVKPPTFVLIDPKNGEFAERLWALMVGEAGVDELLEELSAHGLRSLGDFAMVQIEDSSLRIVVRGAATALVSSGSGHTKVGSSGVRTWVEELFEVADAFTLGLGEFEDETLSYRVRSGILPADLLRWTSASSAAPSLAGLELDWTDSFEPVPTSPEVSKPRSGSEERQSEQLAPEFSGEPEQRVEIRSEPASTDLDRTKAPLWGDDSASPIGVSGESETGDRFDFLYGNTTARSVQAAAVEPELEPEGQDLPDLPPRTEAPPDSVEVESSRHIEQAVGTPEGLIEMVPSSVPTVAPENVFPVQGDHDGRTISSAQLRALQASGANTPASGGPTVLARECGEGHLSPAHAATCRVCGVIIQGTPVETARPVMGELVFSTGRTVLLDKPAIIGRNPGVEGRLQEVPHLVRLDLGKALSRSHAAVRLEGWQVLLEDLGSANGTIVTLPGREERRLHAGEPILLEDGTFIDFGGEISATYHESARGAGR